MNKTLDLLERLDKLNATDESSCVNEKKFDLKKIQGLNSVDMNKHMSQIAKKAANVLFNKSAKGLTDFVLVSDGRGKFVVTDKSIAGHDIINISATSGTRVSGMTVGQIEQAIFNQMRKLHFPVETVGF